jgi:membrane-associated phospholipid phosphatase
MICFFRASAIRPYKFARTLLLIATGFISLPSAADTIETSGDILRVAIPVAAWGVAWHRKDSEGRRRFAYAMAGTLASTYALKKVVDRNRPNGDDEAFPSGHAATAFSGASFIHRRYGFREAVPWYLASAYVGWTRVDADEHDEIDVLAGAVLAVAWTWLLVKPRENSRITPVIARDSAAIQFSFRW